MVICLQGHGERQAWEGLHPSVGPWGRRAASWEAGPPRPRASAPLPICKPRERTPYFLGQFGRSVSTPAVQAACPGFVVTLEPPRVSTVSHAQRQAGGLRRPFSAKTGTPHPVSPQDSAPGLLSPPAPLPLPPHPPLCLSAHRCQRPGSTGTPVSRDLWNHIRAPPCLLAALPPLPFPASSPLLVRGSSRL